MFGTAPAPRARTLRQFVAGVEREPPLRARAVRRRGDFSRWIADVFGDHALAAELRAIEARHRGSPGPDTIPALADAIGATILRDELALPIAG